jgi:hypothetical protein
LNYRNLISIVLVLLFCSFAWPSRTIVSVFEGNMRGYEWQIFYFYDDSTYEFSAWSHTYGNYIFDEGSYKQHDKLLILNSASAIQGKINQKEYGGKHFHLCKNLKLTLKDSSLVVNTDNPRIHFKEYIKWSEEDLYKLTKSGKD